MKTEDVLAILRRNEDALRQRGVRHAAVFGSVARAVRIVRIATSTS
jgi:predicted nucleotidyltransferase